MRVDWASSVGGISLRELRDFIRRYRERAFSPELLAMRLGRDHTDINASFSELLTAGYVEPADDTVPIAVDDPAWTSRAMSGQREGEELNSPTPPAWYMTTDLGRTLASASLKRVPRDKADAAVAAMLERAAVIDVDNRYFYRIGEIIAFGSYLDPATPDLGDVDLVVKTMRRNPNIEMAAALKIYWRRRADEGRQQRGLIDYFAEPELEIVRTLRQRPRILEFHFAQELEELQRKADGKLVMKVLYPH